MIRRKIYEGIKATLANSDLPYKSIALYREQERNEKQEEAMADRPYIMVQFGDTDWKQHADRVQQSNYFRVSIHVLLDITETDDEQLLYRHEFLEYMATVLQGMGIGDGHNAYNTPLIRDREEFDQRPFKVSHDVVHFKTTAKDDSAYQYRKGKPVQLPWKLDPKYIS